jgi:hypothetical protein
MIINIMDKTEKIKYQMLLQATSKSPIPSLKTVKVLSFPHRTSLQNVFIHEIHITYKT